MTDRTSFETAARTGLRLFEAAITDDLPTLLKSDPENFGTLRQSLAEISTLFVQNKLVEKKGKTWEIDANVGKLDTETLEKVSTAATKIVEETGRDITTYALDAAGKQSWLKVALEARDELHDIGFKTPEPRALRDAVAAVAEPAVEAVAEKTPEAASKTEAQAIDPVTMISDERLHDVARASLAVLETLHTAKPDLAGPSHGTLTNDLSAVQGALRSADFLLPGDSSVRKTPYSEQSPRGSRQNNEAIYAAAQNLAASAKGGDAFEGVDFAGGSNPSMVMLGLRSSLGQLAKTIEEAKPQLVGGHEEVKAEQAAPALRLGNEVLSENQAKALHALLNAAEKVSNKAQLDTMSPMHVMYPAKLHNTLEKASKEAADLNVNLVLRSVAKGGEKLPGMSERSAADIANLVDHVSGIVQYAEKRDSNFRAVSMEDMDRLSSLSINARDVGAVTAVAALAGQSDTSTTAFNEGKDTAAFATLREAMAGSRSPSPEAALALTGRVLPEMSLAEWNVLSEETRQKARVFVVNPHNPETLLETRSDEKHGRKDAGELRKVLNEAWPAGSASRDPAAQRWEQIRIRAAVRNSLMTENDKPNLALRSQLMSLRNRAIVAPTRAGAVILREESNRLFEIQEKWATEQKQKRFDNADQKASDFKSADVKRFLSVLEASGSNEPATLTKRGDSLVLEHPEAPTISGNLDRAGNLSGQKEGYRLYKIDAEQLRAAYETGAPTIRIKIADDRPYAIEGVGAKAPVKAKDEVRG